MQEKVDSDIKAALKNGDRVKAEALRMLKSSLINARIAAGHNLAGEEAIKVVRKEIKSRIEARDLYKQNNREKLAQKEESERRLFLSYVPPELSDDELKAVIVDGSKKVESDLSLHNLMPVVMRSVAGKADGKRVSEAVKEYIERQPK